MNAPDAGVRCVMGAFLLVIAAVWKCATVALLGEEFATIALAAEDPRHRCKRVRQNNFLSAEKKIEAPNDILQS